MRLRLRLGETGGCPERLSYINHMTIRRFRGVLRRSAFRIVHWKLVPLRPFLTPLVRVFPEFFVKAVVCVLEKP